MTGFEPGDKVNVGVYGEMTIAHGPFDTPIERGVYLASDDAGYHLVVAENQISPIPPEDPKVEVVAEMLYERIDEESKANPWEKSSSKTYHRNIARSLLAALGAMPQFCKCSEVEHVMQEGCKQVFRRRVRDRDGDVWEEQADESWLMPRDPWYSASDREDLAVKYGPLTEL